MKAQILVASAFVTLVSASAMASGAAPANACQLKATVLALQEVRSELGVTDVVIGHISQTNWVVTFTMNSEQAISATNPAGAIEATVGIKNVTADDCETEGVSVDAYSTNG